MATIEDIIKREANPFDPVTFKTGNFWQEGDQSAVPLVESIHQDAIAQITQILGQVAADHRTRTILLAGDAGSGKSYVLKRLKQSLNSKAFFVYVPPFVDNDYIWRHTLRQTVDSLMHTPEGQTESQLLLWLKNLSVFRDQGLIKKLLGERRLFINNFQSTYPVGIYQAKDFFGVLYDLTNPDLYFTACNWLRGDDLDEDDLKALKVKGPIDSEAAAQSILANLGKISASTYPIVLCFDQIESKRLADGSADIEPVFTINTIFHNESFKNFLVLISIVTNNWRQNSHRIQQSDKDRIERSILLKQISLDQAEALWETRLQGLRRQANPKPKSKIYPLKRDALEQKFPAGKTTPRNALTLGQALFLNHKREGVVPPPPPPRKSIEPPKPAAPAPKPDLTASFNLLWEQEFKKTEQKLSRIKQYSAPELISMLARTLKALQINSIQPKILPSPTYTSYSFSYQSPHNKTIGVIWTEDANMTSFFHIMNACQKLESQQKLDALYLIRAEWTGKANSKGYKLFQQIFAESLTNKHIKPELESVYYLATYDRLVNSVYAQELVVAGNVLQLDELEMLTQRSGVFSACRLLQDLELMPSKGESGTDREKLEKAKEYLLNFVKTQQLISKTVALRYTLSQFPRLTEADIQSLIQDLCQEKQINILDPSAPQEEQIICLIPQG